jgi:hypothetical protein
MGLAPISVLKVGWFICGDYYCLKTRAQRDSAEKPSELKRNEVTWARQDLDKNSFEFNHVEYFIR